MSELQYLLNTVLWYSPLRESYNSIISKAYSPWNIFSKLKILPNMYIPSYSVQQEKFLNKFLRILNSTRSNICKTDAI